MGVPHLLDAALVEFHLPVPSIKIVGLRTPNSNTLPTFPMSSLTPNTSMYMQTSTHGGLNKTFPVFSNSLFHLQRDYYGRDKPSLTFMFDDVTQYGARSRQMVFALEAYDEEGRLMENAQQRLRGIRVSCPLSQPFANTIYSQLLVMTCCRRSLTFPTASRCMSVYRSQRV